MSISSWVDGMLIAEAEEERHTHKVTVRLEPGEYAELQMVARSLDISATKAATGMLLQAISEALGHSHIRRILEAEDEAAREEAEEEYHRSQVDENGTAISLAQTNALKGTNIK